MMILFILLAFCATELIAIVISYRVRKELERSNHEQFSKIGFKDSDGAYLDNFRTLFAIPFKASTQGMSSSTKVKIIALRVYRVFSVCFIATVVFSDMF